MWWGLAVILIIVVIMKWLEPAIQVVQDWLSEERIRRSTPKLAPFDLRIIECALAIGTKVERTGGIGSALPALVNLVLQRLMRAEMSELSLEHRGARRQFEIFFRKEYGWRCVTRLSILDISHRLNDPRSEQGRHFLGLCTMYTPALVDLADAHPEHGDCFATLSVFVDFRKQLTVDVTASKPEALRTWVLDELDMAVVATALVKLAHDAEQDILVCMTNPTQPVLFGRMEAILATHGTVFYWDPEAVATLQISDLFWELMHDEMVVDLIVRIASQLEGEPGLERLRLVADKLNR